MYAQTHQGWPSDSGVLPRTAGALPLQLYQPWAVRSSFCLFKLPDCVIERKGRGSCYPDLSMFIRKGQLSDKFCSGELIMASVVSNSSWQIRGRRWPLGQWQCLLRYLNVFTIYPTLKIFDVEFFTYMFIFISWPLCYFLVSFYIVMFAIISFVIVYEIFKQTKPRTLRLLMWLL